MASDSEPSRRQPLVVDVPVFDLDDPIYEQTKGRQVGSGQTTETIFRRDDIWFDENGCNLVVSSAPPEESFFRGLNIDPQGTVVRKRKITYILPADRSITELGTNGLCIYCQLLLLRDPPKYAMHQPNFQRLLMSQDEGCELCRLLVVSFGRGSQDVKRLYEAGYPFLCDPNARDADVTVNIEKHERYFRLQPCCGRQPRPEFQGDAIVWSTQELLGDLRLRQIWADYNSPQPRTPMQRLDIFKTWLRECAEHHPNCGRNPQSDPPVLPTRVLEITPGNTEETPYKIRLHTSHGEKAAYIALSHRWGPSVPLKTLRSNLAQYGESIDLWSLPLSFRDAIVYAAYLHIQYVWIDSLCIVQDDDADWQREASKMAAVYRNSLLTFAATAANDSSEGFQYTYASAFGMRGGEDLYALIRFEDHLDLDGPDQPLNTRAWTFQEAALSPRMICFAKDQMLWKCNTMHQSEDGLLQLINSRDIRHGSLWNISGIDQQTADDPSMYSVWYTMMQAFSRRDLTFERDKLPALAGITEYQSQLSDTPVLGLWAGDLHNGLLWKTQGFSERADSALNIPSWSWTSIKGPVNWHMTQRQSLESAAENQAEIIELGVEWSGIPMTSAIVSTTLRMSGRLRTARLWQLDSDSFPSVFHLRGTTTSDDLTQQPVATSSDEAKESSRPADVLGYCYLDMLLESDTEVWIFEVTSFVRQLPASSAESEVVHQVLVLFRESPNENTFRRIGMGNVWTTASVQFGVTNANPMHPFENVEKRAIMLV